MYKVAKKMYLDGMSMMAIEREIGFPRKKLSRLLKEDNVLRKFHDGTSLKSKKKYESKEHYQIVEGYLKGKTTLELASEYNISDSKVGRILFYHKIDARKNFFKYNVDDTVFEKVDNEEKAYWLGFLYADGYVNQDNTSLELTLSKKDTEHLSKFKAFMKTESPIKEKKVFLKNKIHYASRLFICNKKICDDLKTLGCINNKGNKLVFPNNQILPKELKHHFMRGYFDGDGSSRLRKDGQRCIEIIGNYDFIVSFRNILHNKLGLNKNKLVRHGKAFGVRYGGNNIYAKFKDYIYKDATVYLERKLL